MQTQTSFADVVQQVRLSNYCTLIGISILCYEYLITLNDEIKFFWGRKVSLVTCLYFVARYMSMASVVFEMLADSGALSLNSCNKLHIMNQIRIVVVQVSVCVILAIRIYALYGRDRRICILLVIIFICEFAVASWSVSGKSAFKSITSIPGCYTALEKEEEIRLSSVWGAILLYDIIVFSLTLWKAVEVWKTGPSRLFRVLVRDGSTYFFVMVMVNLLNILILLLAPPILKDVCTSFTSVLSVIMVSRLMVNIKDLNLVNTLIPEEGQPNTWVFNTFRVSPTTLETDSGALSSMPDF